ncbi:MAG TPA: hypothetical protein VFJ57_07705 [Solirubrobacterales bacterium]|nr:hypothetical protein [Solirubrobacterales bacterium]
MKVRIPRPSPSLVIAMVALFISLGGSAVAVTRSDEPSANRAASRGKLTLRFGKLIDRDTTPFDGTFNAATGHAICDKGERVISGGVRQIHNSTVWGDGKYIWMVESQPMLSKRGWYVQMNSDLGGAARKDFLAVANCERK